MSIHKVAARDVPANRKRGGQMHILLSPLSVGSTSGFMGVAVLPPRERIIKHRHPYSEEFIYVVRGLITVTVDEDEIEVGAGEAIMVPQDHPHRLVNPTDEETFAVFHSSPLAPRPDLGHVDMEEPIGPDQDPQVGGHRDVA
jgi:putative monooxygenase